MSAEKYFSLTPDMEFCPELAKDDYIKTQIHNACLGGGFGGYELDQEGMAEVLPGLHIDSETAAEWTLEAIDVFNSGAYELEVTLK